MKILLGRDKKIQEVKHLTVVIGDSEFRISQSMDDRLVVNKTSYSDESLSGQLWVQPRSSNEVEIV